MKKLITGAIAAVAILLGFAACSGDLHENEVAPLYIEGVTLDRKQMTKVSDTEQIYEFTYVKNSLGWHNTGASIEFKMMVDATGWARDWGAPKDETITLKVGDEEYTPLLNREADGIGGLGPGNIEVYDLVEGQKYTIRMQVDMATLSGKVRIEGVSVAAPDMQIIVSTDGGKTEEKISKIDMTRGGTTYTYEFIAAKTTDIYYYFYCPSLNTTYSVTEYVEDGKNKCKLDPVKDSIQDAHGNNLNADGTVVTDDSYVLNVWKKARKTSILKNHNYSIKIEANDLATGYTGTISYKEEMDNGEEGILKNAVLIGQWKYANNHDGDYAIEPTAKFVADDSTIEFKVLRYSDSNEMAFGSAVELKPGSDYAYGAEKEVEYFTTQVIDDNEFSYKTAKKDTNALEKVKYIKVTDLKKGHTYGFKFDPANIENGKMKVSVTEFKELDLSTKIQGCVFKGAFNGWDPSYPCKDFKDGELEIKGLVNEKGGTDFECGIFEDIGNSTYMYRGATIECKNEAGDYGAPVEFKEYGNNQGENAHIKGLAPNAKFDIKITTNEGKVYVAVKVAEGEKDTRTNLEKFADTAYIKGEISFNSEVSSASKTYAADKKSATIKYGPFRKSDIGEWILTDGSMYYGSCKLGYVDLNGETGTEVTLVANANDGKKNKITDVTFADNFYYIVIRATVDKDGINAVYAKIEPTVDSEIPYTPFKKVYLAGQDPLTWNIGNDNAITANIVAEKAECKNYYYTFEAAATTLEFKVALENSWSDAYSNCKDADGETETILDAAPVEFGYANAKNAKIAGLTEGEKYTMVIDTSSGKPMVSIVSGADVLFAIGDGVDFGKWSWDTPIMMTPVAKGEWKYEFTATQADAAFKFQTTCGVWHDNDTWNAKKEITVGGDYTEMDNGAGEPNTSATLTVGTKYVLSVKSINGKYNVKIATAE